MDKALKWYLWITGIGAVVVVTLPWLVTVGLVAFVVPGLILFALPTAFLWGAAFALCRRYLKRSMPVAAASVAALAVAAALLAVLPLPGRVAAARSVERHAAADILPDKRIRPAGDIRLELMRPRWDQDKRRRIDRHLRPYACDALCVAFLLTPDVKSVTVNKLKRPVRRGTEEDAVAIAPFARTYRLGNEQSCKDGAAVSPVLQFGGKLWDAVPGGWQALKARWQRRFAAGDCIVSEPPLVHYDLLISESRFRHPKRAKTGVWSLNAAPAVVWHLEMRDRSNTVLLQIRRVSVRGPAVPLMITPENGNLGIGMRFGWSRSTLTDDHDPSLPDNVLEAVRLYTTIPRSLQAAAPRDTGQ